MIIISSSAYCWERWWNVFGWKLKPSVRRLVSCTQTYRQHELLVIFLVQLLSVEVYYYFLCVQYGLVLFPSLLFFFRVIRFGWGSRNAPSGSRSPVRYFRLEAHRELFDIYQQVRSRSPYRLFVFFWLRLCFKLSILYCMGKWCIESGRARYDFLSVVRHNFRGWIAVRVGPDTTKNRWRLATFPDHVRSLCESIENSEDTRAGVLWNTARLLCCVYFSSPCHRRERERMRFTWCGLGPSTWGLSCLRPGLTTGDLSARRHENLWFVCFIPALLLALWFLCLVGTLILLVSFLSAWATHAFVNKKKG